MWTDGAHGLVRPNYVILIVEIGAVLRTDVWDMFTQELAGLRELLQHLDDVDDIFQAVAREG